MKGEDALERLRARLLATGPDDPFALSHYPTVLAILCLKVDIKGRKARPGTVSITLEGPFYQATLTSRGLKLSTSIYAESLDAVLTTLERAALDPKTVWRELRR